METLITKLDSLYASSPTILEWEKFNEPNPELIYKNGLSHQAKALFSLPNVIRSKLDLPKVVSRHSSKSVGLPVSCFKMEYDRGYILMRDNFYDIKLAVVSKFGVDMSYQLVHQELSQEAYDAEKKRCFDYCSRVSSDFDPKDYDSDAWMKKWSGDYILRAHDKIWRAWTVSSVYCEGMGDVLSKEVFVPYQDGKNTFTCSLGSYAQAGIVIDAVQRSNERKFYEERNKEREHEDSIRA